MIRWILLFSAAVLFSTETLLLSREDGSELIAYCDRPKEKNYPIMLLIPGSQKETSIRLHDALKDDLLRKGFCAITLEKRESASEEFDLSIHERTADHLIFYQNIKELCPDWNGKIAILGQGDGGRVGAHFAVGIDEIQAIALIASGGGWAPLDELLYSFRSEMANDGFSPQYIHGFLTQAKQELAQAVKLPKVDQKAFGYSHKYWESLLKTHLGKDLSQLRCPIYSINGDKDDRIPIESVEYLAKAMEDRMILIRKDEAGREILGEAKVYREAISQICQNFD